MVAKFTGDYFSKNGIYESACPSLFPSPLPRLADKLPLRLAAWINLRNYPFLNTKLDYRRDTFLARHVMTPVNELACVTDEGWEVSRLGASFCRAALSVRGRY